MIISHRVYITAMSLSLSLVLVVFRPMMVQDIFQGWSPLRVFIQHHPYEILNICKSRQRLVPKGQYHEKIFHN